VSFRDDAEALYAHNVALQLEVRELRAELEEALKAVADADAERASRPLVPAPPRTTLDRVIDRVGRMDDRELARVDDFVEQVLIDRFRKR
jgi:hypothetical protein